MDRVDTEFEGFFKYSVLAPPNHDEFFSKLTDSDKIIYKRGVKNTSAYKIYLLSIEIHKLRDIIISEFKTLFEFLLGRDTNG